MFSDFPISYSFIFLLVSRVLYSSFFTILGRFTPCNQSWELCLLGDSLRFECALLFFFTGAYFHCTVPIRHEDPALWILCPVTTSFLATVVTIPAEQFQRSQVFLHIEPGVRKLKLFLFPVSSTTSRSTYSPLFFPFPMQFSCILAESSSGIF